MTREKRTVNQICQDVVDCYNEIGGLFVDNDTIFTQGMLKAYLNTLGFNSWEEFKEHYKPLGKLVFWQEKKDSSDVAWYWHGKEEVK